MTPAAGARGALRGRRASPTARWLALYIGARLAAAAFAVALILWGGPGRTELLLLLYGPLSTALLAGKVAENDRPLVGMLLDEASEGEVADTLRVAPGDVRHAVHRMLRALRLDVPEARTA